MEILDEGVAGELQVRGPSTMNGYSRFHDATTGVSTADWLRTGDLGCVKRGNVYILGRMKVRNDRVLDRRDHGDSDRV